MNFTFTPTQKQEVKVPYIEDARADYAPYYATRKTSTIIQAKENVAAEIGKLGGMVSMFQEGYFGSEPKRYGYVIRFIYEGAEGRIVVAGLPMRVETPSKKHQVLKQALYNVRDWLKAAVTAKVFNPGSDVLMQYLLIDDKRTLVDYLREYHKMPLLASGDNDVIDM